MTDIVRITKLDEVNIQIDSNRGIIQELSDYFTFTVPGYTFMPAFKNKVWDGKIRLLNIRDNTLYGGLCQYVEKFCKDREYEILKENFDNDELVTYKDLVDETKKYSLTVEPRDYQYEAATHCINNKRALLLSPTASGKSLIIFLLLRYFNTRSLIIVPTISLTQQMYTDFASYDTKWNAEQLCYIIKQGQEKTSDKQVVISTWQSIYKLPKKYFKDFEFVVGDEAHLFKAKSLKTVMSKLTNAKYRFGTTGTIDDAETHKLILEGLFGPLHSVTTTKDLIDANYLSKFQIKVLILKYGEEDINAIKKKSYQEEMDFIVNHSKRNNFIRNLAIDQKGNTLLLFQYVEKHGKILYDLIAEKADDNRKVFFVHGGVDGDQREEIRRITEQEGDAIIVASYGTFSTGINIRNLHNIIFASPTKSKIRNLQSIGRGLRKGDNKKEATLFDIADDFSKGAYTNYTLQHFKERVKQYNEQEFKYHMYTIKM